MKYTDQFETSLYFKDERRVYDTGVLVYVCKHYLHNAAEGDLNWHCWKYTMDGDDLVRVEGPLIGSYTGVAALAWGA